MQKGTINKFRNDMLAAQSKLVELQSAMETEREQHADYVQKTDDFVSILEDERERLKVMLHNEQQKANDRQDFVKYHDADEEVERLRNLTVELAEERKEKSLEIKERESVINELTTRLEEAADLLQSTKERYMEEKEQALRLEREMDTQANEFNDEIDQLKTLCKANEIKQEEYHNQLETAHKQIKKLRKLQKNLRKTDDKLLDIKAKVEEQNKSEEVLEELTTLRKQVEELKQAEKLVQSVQNSLTKLNEDSLALTDEHRKQEASIEKLINDVSSMKNLHRFTEEVKFKIKDESDGLLTEIQKAKELGQTISEMNDHLLELDRKDSENSQREDDVIAIMAETKKMVECHKKTITDLKLQLKNEKDKNSELTKQLNSQKSILTEEYDSMCEKLTATTRQLNEMKDGKKIPDEAFPDANVEQIEQKYITQVKLLKERLRSLETIEEKLTFMMNEIAIVILKN